MGEKMTLLPCPFCGSADILEGEVLSEHPDGRTTKQNQCGGCGTLGPEVSSPDYGDVLSNAAWNRRHLTQPAQAVDVGAIASRLRGASDAAYCDYIRQLSTTECLGWESKVSRGKFGRAELDAHNRAHEMLGRHRALSEAVAILTTAALPNANGKEGTDAAR